MQTHILGYPRIGNFRTLKKASEQYWAGKITREELIQTGATIRKENWLLQKEAGINFIPVNDFSFYDQVLDLTLTLGNIPERYAAVKNVTDHELDVYFAMARGYQQKGLDVTAMEMTKWFDTNYHYIVPEFTSTQKFSFASKNIVESFKEAKALDINAKPVIIGPVTYLLLGKAKEAGLNPLSLLPALVPVYKEIITALKNEGATTIQIDEPFLALDLNAEAKQAYTTAYSELKGTLSGVEVILATYFEGLKDNAELAFSLPINVLHIDLVRDPKQLATVLAALPSHIKLSLGIVDGRNIWKNDFNDSLAKIKEVVAAIGEDRVWIAPSSSLLHSPCDLDLETNEKVLTPEIKQWLAFAKQKVYEVVTLKDLASGNPSAASQAALKDNQQAAENRRTSTLIHNKAVQDRTAAITDKDATRNSPFSQRQVAQHASLKLPLYPTTTIGSFPQTTEVRSWRAQFKKGSIDAAKYDALLKEETERAIKWQEDIGIDVLVHGEFERNDMVEYFGEQLAGFTFTKNGWVQSYGSRCVKPPVIYGDVHRTEPLTVYWAKYAQSLTDKYVKGMLTGPVTILQWSFVRNDQPRSTTCNQIALAIRDEVSDLESASIKIIQIDEPAIREGLPLRKADQANYLNWAVKAFRISASSVQDDTQIHTHMCYSEFNDIIEHIAAMDADVITIECSRSQMELLDIFAEFKYPNEIGPGVYDIHSPRVPSKEEMVDLLEKAGKYIPAKQLWVNPDCGLKTRHWDETQKALKAMVEAAQELRQPVNA